MLTREEVQVNAQTYMDQFFHVVDKSRTVVRWQSEWYEKFTLTDVFNLTSRFTMAQVMAHETFRKRYESGLPLTMMELMYPMLQAYDSVAIEADVEFGGTDQKFNNLFGRDLQSMLGQRPQDVFLVPLLPGLDGRKMSKSFGNTVDLNLPPAGPKVLDTELRRLQRTPAPYAHAGTVPVPFSALDFNGHVNNTEYVRWAFDGLHRHLGHVPPLRAVQVTYAAEVFEDDEIEVLVAAEPGAPIRVVERKAGGPADASVFLMEID